MNADPIETALEAACAAGEYDAIRAYADMLEERGYMDHAQLLALWHAWETQRTKWPADLRRDVAQRLRSMGGDYDRLWLERMRFPFRGKVDVDDVEDALGDAIAETLAARRQPT